MTTSAGKFCASAILVQIFLAIVVCGVFEEMGPLPIRVFQTSFSVLVPCNLPVIEPPLENQPPTRLLVAVPCVTGHYPVVVFQHGFLIANCFYSQLIKHIASYGYIVVAPQIIKMDRDATREIEDFAEVVNWLPGKLYAVVNVTTSPALVTPNLEKIVLAGHSRGAKVAFALALGLVSNTSVKFSGLVAIDPVDGDKESTKPAIVEETCDRCRKIRFPTLIEGTGYGGQQSCIGPACSPACAPLCCNHQAFYKCSSAPNMYHFVASEFGHLDFLDESPSWTSIVCKSGNARKPLRKFTGGLLVAFLFSALNDTSEHIDQILINWQNASIKLEQPEYYTSSVALSAL